MRTLCSYPHPTKRGTEVHKDTQLSSGCAHTLGRTPDEMPFYSNSPTQHSWRSDAAAITGRDASLAKTGQQLLPLPCQDWLMRPGPALWPRGPLMVPSTAHAIPAGQTSSAQSNHPHSTHTGLALT